MRLTRAEPSRPRGAGASPPHPSHNRAELNAKFTRACHLGFPPLRRVSSRPVPRPIGRVFGRRRSSWGTGWLRKQVGKPAPAGTAKCPWRKAPWISNRSKAFCGGSWNGSRRASAATARPSMSSMRDSTSSHIPPTRRARPAPRKRPRRLTGCTPRSASLAGGSNRTPPRPSTISSASVRPWRAAWTTLQPEPTSLPAPAMR